MIRAVRNLRIWIVRFADSPHASFWLFTIACVEASLFPVPPDILLLTLCLAHPGRSIRFAAICTAGSVAGAFLGYAIGYAVFDTIGSKLLSMGGLADQFALVLEKYRENAWIAIIVAGFTPIPFAVFSLAAGFHLTIDPGTFAPAVVIGRSLRFFLVGGLLQFVGPRMHLSALGVLQNLTIALSVLFVLGIVTMRYLF